MHFIFDLHRTLISYPESHGRFIAKRCAELDATRFDSVLQSRLFVISRSPEYKSVNVALNGPSVVSRPRWQSLFLEILDEVSAQRTIDVQRAVAESYDRLGLSENWRVFDDVPRALARIQERGHTAGILSNFDPRADGLIADLFPHYSWSCRLLSYEVCLVKPDVAIFESYLERLRVSGTECIMIGDDPAQDGASVLAGIPFMRVNYPHVTVSDVIASAL